MEMHVNPSRARARDWKYHHEYATHARSISHIATPMHENYTNLVVSQKDESFKNFILAIFLRR